VEAVAEYHCGEFECVGEVNIRLMNGGRVAPPGFRGAYRDHASANIEGNYAEKEKRRQIQKRLTS